MGKKIRYSKKVFKKIETLFYFYFFLIFSHFPPKIEMNFLEKNSFNTPTLKNKLLQN